MNTKVMVARKERRLTQEALAADIGINQADLVRIERHGWIPPKDIRQRLAVALASPEEELFGSLPVVASDPL